MWNMARRSIIVPVIMFSVLATGCIGGQPRVQLMPTPVVLSTGELDPFRVNPDLEESTRVKVLFATNRKPAGEGRKREYRKRPGEMLRIGVAQVHIGEERGGWDEIIELSTSGAESPRPTMTLEEMEELLAIPIEDDGQPLPARAATLAEKINRSLAGRLDKNIMVYVHGANANVYRAASQAAQYRHFTGRNSLVLAFLWPTGEHLLRYGKDVRQARQSVEAFHRLITLLAGQTTAEQINILAYSAGAMVVSPALARLGKEYPEARRDELRLGEIYYAAPDVGTDRFIEDLRAYHHLPRSVTLSVNPNDSVLRNAQRLHRTSRAGRPDKGDLDEEALQWTREASRGAGLEVLMVDSEIVVGLAAGSHSFWYSHPWLSSDVLVQFLFSAAPHRRGLVEKVSENGLRYWTFPPDYPERIVRILQEARDAAAE